MKPNKLYLPKKFHNEFKKAEVTIDAPIYHDKFNDSNVEFVEVSSIWHKPSEEPQVGKMVIAIRGFCFKWEGEQNGFTWRRATYCYDIKGWAYLEDILPKGGVL